MVPYIFFLKHAGMSLYFWIVVKTVWVKMYGKKNKITTILPTVGTVVISVISPEVYDKEKITTSKPPDTTTLKPIARAFNRLKIINKLR